MQSIVTCVITFGRTDAYNGFRSHGHGDGAYHDISEFYELLNLMGDTTAPIDAMYLMRQYQLILMGNRNTECVEKRELLQ
ncbi:hypothetical protein J2T15_004045 [Paenibacillus harenae]|uniref:Uncharacterized protein n=1 Tax=Paenibacillus harenae TaxID=306543 RepID=A0ABT9U4M0_PAEHA|nr:hypothetical protein [Paenibacillus harenae]